MSRNETFTIWLYYPDWKSKLSVIRRLFRHATAICAFGKQKIMCLKMMLLGFADGRAGRLGIKYIPTAGHGSRADHTVSRVKEKTEPQKVDA
jgi:hypothetical protein